MTAYKLYEVATFAIGVGLGAEIVGLPVINRDTWNKLPPDIQGIFMKTAEDAKQFNAQNLAKYTEEGIKKIKEGKATISEFSWDDRVKWANLMDDYPSEWAKEMNAKGLPGTEVMRLFLSSCNKLGHTFPRQWAVK